MLLFWKTRFFLWFDQLKTIYFFYRKPRFALCDLLLGALYLFSNPFRICRRYMESRGEGRVHIYGETPLCAWKSIAELAQIRADDLFVDLGCGRGKICFWTAAWIGCKTIGIDWVPPFIRKASLLARLPGFSHLKFLERSISKIPLDRATVLYLYTFHPEESLLKLPAHSRVITVSEPLADSRFHVTASQKIRFPWGETEVYINTVRKCS